ncbi:MAG: hypothetical protein P4L90_13670 [Rhodopila sp.]|nr:hypothetical protein [Rhodopila sp.]
MLNRRFHLHGLFAVLLALMAQLGMGASVPRIDPIVGAETLCHTTDDTGGTPSQAPVHPADCLICPLCIIHHAQPATLVSDVPSVTPPGLVGERRVELPPPSTAPPTAYRLPSQPRAPPIYS